MVVAINSTKISLLLNFKIYQSHKHIAFISIISRMESCAKKKEALENNSFPFAEAHHIWKTQIDDCHSQFFATNTPIKQGKKKKKKNQTKQTTPRFESSNKKLATQPPPRVTKYSRKKRMKNDFPHTHSRVSRKCCSRCRCCCLVGGKPLANSTE